MGICRLDTQKNHWYNFYKLKIFIWALSIKFKPEGQTQMLFEEDDDMAQGGMPEVGDDDKDEEDDE